MLTFANSLSSEYVKIYGGQFTENIAVLGCGGAFHGETESLQTLDSVGSFFSNNSTIGTNAGGGSLYCINCNVSIENMTCWGSYASSGGCFYLSISAVRIVNTNCFKNLDLVYGGCGYAFQCTGAFKI